MQERLQCAVLTWACRSLLGSRVNGRFQTEGGAFVKDARITDAHGDEEFITIRLDSEQHLSFWMEITLSRTQLLAFLQEK